MHLKAITQSQSTDHRKTAIIFFLIQRFSNFKDKHKDPLPEHGDQPRHKNVAFMNTNGDTSVLKLLSSLLIRITCSLIESS